MKDIAVLTYSVKHRKTYDVLCLLKIKGYINVHVYAKPFHYVKKFHPLVEHRPAVGPSVIETSKVCDSFNYKYSEIIDYCEVKEQIVLICGAGILPEQFVNEHIVLNAHPGYIPNCRGLDALKWAILEGQPIGVTTHVLGNYVDAGEIIERKIVPVFNNDTFFFLSQRVYENEISMLVDAIEKLEQKHIYIVPEEHSIVHKRMHREQELDMLEKFKERVENEGISAD